MNTFLFSLYAVTLDTPTIILIVVGGVLLLIVLLILYLSVFSHARLKRQTRDLCSVFEREHALLFGQDAQYVHRLENISNMNLTYVDPSMEWSRRFKDVRDTTDASAQAAVNNLKDLLSERRYKELKATLPTARRTIEDYANRVDSLSESLKNKFHDEDEIHSLSLELKERYRNVKQEYQAHQSDMSILASTFGVLFTKLDSSFTEVEQNIDAGHYNECKITLNNRIAPVLSSLEKALRELPNICLLISSVIPDKLISLSNHYDEMTQAGYPLHHILLRTDMDSMNQEIKHLGERVQSLDLAGVPAQLDKMMKEIDQYLADFEKEKEARVVFEKEIDQIYANETALENSFINLCHAIPKVRQIFLLDSSDQAKIDAIQITINKAGASKRSLDTYIHSVTKQPYSILVDKMHTLRDQGEEASKSIASFQNYLVSFKQDCEAANAALKTYTARLSEIQKTLHDIHLASIDAKYLPRVDELYHTIDALTNDLKSTPIAVSKVNTDMATLQRDGDALIAEVKTTLEDMNKAEAMIVCANRRRGASSELNAALLQAESLFLNGNFKQSYDISSLAFKNVKGQD